MGINKNINKDFLYYATLGHSVKSVKSKGYSNLLGFRKGVSLINTEKTEEGLAVISHFLNYILTRNFCSILFVNLDSEWTISTKIGALKSVQPFLIEGWWGGTFTNVLSKSKVDVIFLLNVKKHDFILQEARKLSIPVIAVVDTDLDSNLVTFPIWLNDDSIEVQHDLVFLVSSIILQSKLTNYGLACIKYKYY